MTRRRLDAELVRRGLARSRAEAAELIDAGSVRVDGQGILKAATAVSTAAAVVVRDTEDRYVSRGGQKLAGALAGFRNRGLVVAERCCLDAGASTGGFTDVLLRAGAAEITCVDVGYGQLAWSLRQDPRVRVLDRTNVRDLHALEPPPDLVVADLSFVSLTLALPALRRVARADADFVVLVKPQFESERDRVGKGGVVRDPADWAAAVRRVAAVGTELGLGTAGITPSPVRGPAGNVEVFCWLAQRAGPLDEHELAEALAGAPGPRERVR